MKNQSPTRTEAALAQRAVNEERWPFGVGYYAPHPRGLFARKAETAHRPPVKATKPTPVAVETSRRREVLRKPATDFSHLLNARRAGTVLRLPEPTTSNDFKQTELGASEEVLRNASRLSERILAAGEKAKTRTGTGATKPTGLAAQIIAAGQKRRGLNGVA
ncbi:MAG: hypothetical protein ABSC06_26425 [Rhodopila sp.]|jgi:hypothetical protein